MDNVETISEDGQAPETRVKDAKSAHQIWDVIRKADGPSAFYRATVDAAYDNEKPFDDAKLQANGQSYRVNVSWGFMDSVLETAMAGYVDIYSAVENLFECPTDYGTSPEKYDLEDVVAKEVSDCIRSWPDFYWNYLRLCNVFIKHGVSVAMFPDETDWRWSATDMSDFKLPRKTKIGQDNIGFACFLRLYSPTDLFNMIRDEDTAKELGYNVEEIRKKIVRAVQENPSYNYRGDDWEAMQAEFRNNDGFYANGSADAESIRVVHMLIKEFNGKITHVMFSDDAECDYFLYQRIGRYDNSYQAFIIFCFGVGTNGYYHGIRGQGYKVFPINGALNIAACQMLENATYGSSVTFQPRDETALQDMQFLPTGPYNLLSPGIEVVPNTVMPNVAQNSIPVLQMFQQLFRDRTSQYNTESLINNAIEKTRAQVMQEASNIAKMSVSALNLFYIPLELLVKETVRRIKRETYSADQPGGEYIVRLHKRLLKMGIESGGQPERYLQALYKLDINRLTITRAIGAGSDAARQMIFDRLMSMYGQYPDSGKQSLIWDITATQVGHSNAERYATRPGENERPTVDTSIAQLENQVMTMGGEIHRQDGQNDAIHTREHLSFEEPLLKEAEDALGKDDMETLGKLIPGISAVNAHTSEHVKEMSGDPLMKQDSATARQALQQAEEVLHNGTLKLQKFQADQAKAQQEAEGEAQQGPPPIDPVKLQKIETDRAVRMATLNMAKESHTQKMEMERQKFAQEMMLKDAETASKIQRTGVRA